MKLIKVLCNCICITALSLLTACESGGEDDAEISLERIAVQVVEYNPAPGQFVNIYPQCSEGETYSTVLSRATTALNSDKLVTLGSFGGYIIVKTDKPVTGRFQVAGNAIVSSSEPGIVQISADGKKWYTICGDHYKNTSQISVTYSRPAENFTDETYIPYTTSDGKNGYVSRITEYHTQPYFPLWDTDNSQTVTFSGRRLPDNGKYNSDIAQYQLSAYYGYADSYPNTSTKSYLDPANIVDENLQPASLPSFSYIRVYTGVLQSNGILGECSTEVTGFYRIIE